MDKDFVLFLGGDAIIFIAKVRIFRAEVRRFSARIFGTDIWRYEVGILICQGDPHLSGVRLGFSTGKNPHIEKAHFLPAYIPHIPPTLFSRLTSTE